MSQVKPIPYNLSFEPGNPAQWKSPCYAYNPNLEPPEGLLARGFDRKTLMAVKVIAQLRDTVVENRLSLFITVDGRHRSGKSRFVFLASCLMSNSFEKNPEKFMVQDAEGLLALTEEIDREKIKNPIIIVDEAGSALNKGDWQERIQKAVIKTLTVIGYLHPTIFFCAPLRSFILKGIRDMSHIYIRVSRHSKEYATVEIYKMNYNSLYNKMFYRRPILHFYNQPIKVTGIRVSLPPKHIDDIYSEIELRRKPITLHDIRADVKQIRSEKKRNSPDYETMSKEIIADVNAFSSPRSKPGAIKINTLAVKTRYGCSLVAAQQIKFMVEAEMNGNKFAGQEAKKGMA